MAALTKTMGELEAAWKGRRVIAWTLTATQVFALVDNLSSLELELWVATA